MRRPLHVSILLASLIALSACTTMAPAPTPTQQASVDSSTLSSWRSEGKIGLRVKEKGGSVYFTWQQKGDDFTLDMAGPLGQGQTRLSGNSDYVSLENATTGRVDARTPEAVMQHTLGWQAPVSHLKYWIRGLPATPNAMVVRNDSGQISQIKEDGWQTDITNYTVASGFLLPSKLQIIGPDTKLTVLISQWQPNP